MNPLPRIINHHDWILAVLLLIVLLFTLVVSNNRTLISKVLLANFFKQYYISLQREEHEIYSKISLLLNFISLLSVSLFLYLLAKVSGFENQLKIKGFILFLLTFSALTAFVLLQYLFARLSAWVFKTETETNEYQFNIWLAFKLLGITLLPFCFFIQYSEQNFSKFFIHISLILIALILVHRYFVGLRIGIQLESFPKIYSILYICTLELLPILILVKMFKTEIQTILSF